MKNKNKKQKIHTDRYLITYADLLTLLLGLFAILFATSQVDLAKYREVAAAMGNVFNPVSSSDSAKNIAHLNSKIETLPPPIIVVNNNKSIAIVKKEIETALKPLISNKKIELESTKDGFKLLLNEELLFLPNTADLQQNGLDVLASIALVLKNVNKQINVDGHTDAIPIRTLRYESNWHLASARALSVLYQLKNDGVLEPNMVARTMGSQRPIADNATEEGRKRNRRVEISITDKDAAAAAVNSTEIDSLAQQ